MANTKANIYPVQLEGATLNINQYNAEIKQFAGFNRLNSPYVGGCLSNIWQKDTTIEGATKDNTYIAPNGDIYRVDTTGFYENNNKLVDYSDNKFYGVKKLNLPVNTIKAINEKIYVTEEGGNYVAHWGNGYTRIISSVNTYWKGFVDISYNYNCIVFTSKIFKKTNINSDYTESYVNILYVPDETSSISTPYQIVNTENLRFEHSQAAFIDENYIIIAPNILTSMKYAVNYLIINKSNSTSTTVQTFNYSAGYCFSNYVANYYMTNSGEITYIFMCSATDTNVVYASTTGPLMIIRGKLSVNNLGELKLNTVGGTERAYFPYPVKLHQFTTPLDDGSTNYHNFAINGKFTPCGCHFVYSYYGQKYENETYTYYRGYVTNDCGVIGAGSGVNGELFEKSAGSFTVRKNFKILFNNNQVSGVSVIANNSFNGNLVTDWNSIKEDTLILFNNDTEFTYQDSSSGVFYTVFESIPSLSLKYNQIVTNSNNQLNSVNLNTKKLLHFAPDWNDSIIFAIPNATNAATLGRYIEKNSEYPTPTNKTFLSGAINEYYLQLNSSIIINPVKSIRDLNDLKSSISSLKVYSIAVYGKVNPETAINIYLGNIENNKCLYNFSFCDTYNENPDLVGLPYPTDTNGNVSYCPNIFSKFFSDFGNNVFVKNNSVAYPLSEYNNKPVMSYYLGSMIEGLEETFVIQGQYYGIIDRKIFAFTFSNGVAGSSTSVVSVQGLKYCGSTPYMALFWSETNRTLYSFTGSNTLTASQSIDKVSTVIDYDYNPATQSTYLITDIGVIIISNMGTYILEIENIVDSYLLDNGAVFFDDSGNYHYIAYYKPSDEYVKKNIELETCFYGADNTTVSINDTLYLRLFSPDKEAGEIVVSAVTISNEGKKTEKTTFKIKASDWDADTNSIYLRYQPKQQRGLGTSFAISSPFKIASISVGNTLETILVDKISKTAINAPAVVSKNTNW